MQVITMQGGRTLYMQVIKGAAGGRRGPQGAAGGRRGPQGAVGGASFYMHVIKGAAHYICR